MLIIVYFVVAAGKLLNCYNSVVVFCILESRIVVAEYYQFGVCSGYFFSQRIVQMAADKIFDWWFGSMI